MKKTLFMVILLPLTCLYSQNTFNKIYNGNNVKNQLCISSNGFVTTDYYGESTFFSIYDSTGGVTNTLKVPLFYGANGSSQSKGLYYFSKSNNVVSLQIETPEENSTQPNRLSIVSLDMSSKAISRHTVDNQFISFDTSYYVSRTLPTVKLNDSTIVCLADYITKYEVNGNPLDHKQVLIVINESGSVKSVKEVLLDSLNDYLTSFDLVKSGRNSVQLVRTSYIPKTTPPYRFIAREYTIDTSATIYPKYKINRLGTISINNYLYTKNITSAFDNSFYMIYNYGDNYFNDQVNNKFVVKLDSNYNEVWRRIIPGWLNNTRNFVIATKDGGCMALTHKLQSPNLPRNTPMGIFVDVTLTKLNFKGDIEFITTYGDSLDDRGFDIVEDDDGGFVIVGLFNTIIDFWTVYWEGASNQAWMFKVNKYGLPAKTVGVIEDISAIQDFLVYPNPVNTQLSVNISNEKFITSIDIIDVVGNVVLQQKSNYVSIENIKTFDLSSLSCGTYYCKINCKNYSITKPFVIIR